jgi:hypothetical protein
MKKVKLQSITPRNFHGEKEQTKQFQPNRLCKAFLQKQAVSLCIKTTRNRL